MKSFQSIQEVLDYAIGQEQAAYEFYLGLAKNARDIGLAGALEEFAQEELGHKAKLEAVKRGEYLLETRAGPAPGLGLAEHLVEGELTPEMGYPEALILAMKKEKASYRLYMDLAALADDAATQSLFVALAGEEAKHKLRFEIEYDDYVLKES